MVTIFLQVDNVAGAFLVLMIGMGLSVVTAVVEFFWVSRSALANQNVRYIPWQTPKTANINTNSNWQFPSLIKRSSPDRQSEPFTEWSDVKLWSKRKKGSVYASRFLSQSTAIFATCVDWELNQFPNSGSAAQEHFLPVRMFLQHKRGRQHSWESNNAKNQPKIDFSTTLFSFKLWYTVS